MIKLWFIYLFIALSELREKYKAKGNENEEDDEIKKEKV